MRLASITTTKFEEMSDTQDPKNRGDGGAAVTEGKMINLSIETKVAIAVTTGFLVLIVGAMAQG